MSSPQFFVDSPKSELISSPAEPPPDRAGDAEVALILPAEGALDSCCS